MSQGCGFPLWKISVWGPSQQVIFFWEVQGGVADDGELIYRGVDGEEIKKETEMR